nr:ABC transporter ATP-binding protein [uncultured Anaerostipes sp.]
MAAIIEFQDIAKKYGEKTIMEHFNLSVEEEEFLTIIGSSGCGKTTMLKMVNGLISPDEGNVRVWKEDVAKTDQIKLRRSIGYSIQGNVLFPHMTVEENISYVPDLLNRRDKKKTREAVVKWMEIVGLSDDMRNRFPSELSGGQQQRVGIVRALAASPEILLMDEPFGAVDEITRSQLQKEIKRIHQKTGVTILFVTHDIGEALYLGTKVLVLDHGEIQQYGTPEEIKKHPSNEFVKKLLYNRQDKYGEAAIG